MKQLFSVTVIVAIALSVPLFMASCGEAEELYNCSYICARYKDCFDSEYDAVNCTDECEDRSDSVQGYESKAELCQDCIDDKACGESFACVDECVGIVP